MTPERAEQLARVHVAHGWPLPIEITRRLLDTITDLRELVAQVKGENT
jgi:hypothetical protein